MQSTSASVELLGMDQAGLRAWFTSSGEPAFRAQQLIQWVHQRGQLDFDAMTDLSKSLRTRLHHSATITLPTVVQSQCSTDGTRKWLLSVNEQHATGGNRIEMVFIPEESRGTLCISSQVGCSLDCSFCATARQGFNRNLTSAEIIGQVWLARRLLAEESAAQITNIVLMGMGEPLLNLNNVVPALNLMLDDHAYGLSKRRVTVSTAGIVPAIDRLSELTDVSLALSLHAPNDELRDELVPINKKFPLAELLAACERYIERRPQRRITIEYVMLDGLNDSVEHARQLAKLLRNLPSKINLIPFNPFPDAGYRCSSAETIRRFSDYLSNKDYVVTIRKTRGDDIAAACGQLVGQVVDRSQRQLRFSEPRFGAQPLALAK